jgi:hypothetical protein
VASTPNPARLRDYQESLEQMLAQRATHAAAGNDAKVTNLNRQIQAQMKWIAAAEKLVAPAA